MRGYSYVGNILKKIAFANNSNEKQDTLSDAVKTANQNDPLNPEQHQKMCLLFYSFSARSSNAPNFCINPS